MWREGHISDHLKGRSSYGNTVTVIRVIDPPESEYPATADNISMPNWQMHPCRVMSLVRQNSSYHLRHSTHHVLILSWA
jgi:hypothetical protein